MIILPQGFHVCDGAATVVAALVLVGRGIADLPARDLQYRLAMRLEILKGAGD